MSVTQAIKVDARKEYRSHAKMDEIDETSLEQVAAAHDGAGPLPGSMTPARPPISSRRFARWRQARKAKLVAYATASTTQSCFARGPPARQPDA